MPRTEGLSVQGERKWAVDHTYCNWYEKRSLQSSATIPPLQPSVSRALLVVFYPKLMWMSTGDSSTPWLSLYYSETRHGLSCLICKIYAVKPIPLPAREVRHTATLAPRNMEKENKEGGVFKGMKAWSQHQTSHPALWTRPVASRLPAIHWISPI